MKDTLHQDGAVSASSMPTRADPPRDVLREFVRSDAVIFSSLAVAALIALAAYVVAILAMIAVLIYVGVHVHLLALPCMLFGLVVLVISATASYRTYMRIYDRALEISQETDMIQAHRRRARKAARAERRAR